MSTPMATSKHRVRASLPTTACAAGVGLLVRLALRLVRFDHVTHAVRWLAGTTRQPAKLEEVLSTLRAVDAGAEWIPVRMACLERSLTAVILLAGRRRGVTWQMGVRTPPLAAHAWLADANGEPIGEPPTTAAYRPLITISAPHANRSTT